MITIALGEVDAAVVAQSQSGFVENAEQQLPQAVRSFFDFVKQHQRDFHVVGVHAIEILLRQHRRSFAMAQVSRRRANQLRDFVRMLKLGAVDLHDRVRVAIKNFGGGFDHASFSGAGRSEKQHRADRPVGRIHARQKNLVQAAHAADCAFLTDDARVKPLFKILSARALLIGIEENCTCIVHVCCSVISISANIGSFSLQRRGYFRI